MIIVAVIERYIPNFKVDDIGEVLGCDVEKTYYKIATLEALKQEKCPVVLHQRLDIELNIFDIEEVFNVATNMVLIMLEKYRDEPIIKQLFEMGIYNIIFEDEVDSDIITTLINRGRTEDEAKEYLCIF